MKAQQVHSPGAVATEPVSMGAETPSLRVTADLSILRHGPSGSARWASGLVRALSDLPEIEIRGWLGPPRRRFRGPVRKIVNAAQDRLFYEALLPAAAWRWGADVLLMPVNLSARRTRLPQVVTIHDVNFLIEPDSFDPWFRAYATRMFARAIRDAAVITTVSASSRWQLHEHLGVPMDRVEVVYPGLDPVPEVTSPAPLDEPYALFVGTTEPHKNVDLLLDAWSAHPVPALTLVVAGRPGRAHDALAARAARLASRVVMTGELDQAALERWYHYASVFLFPSLTEGFGYPPLEAMARGVPVIASNAGSLPEVLGDAARYHNPHDADALRRNLESLLGDTQAREGLIARGRMQAARFSWAAAAKSMGAALSAAVVGTWHGAGPLHATSEPKGD